MSELVARVARPQDESRWIEAAQSRTVREMRKIVLEAMAEERARGGVGAGRHAAALVVPGKELVENAAGLKSTEQLGGAVQEGAAEDEDSEVMCTLTCTVDQEEAWLFEATRALLEQLGTRGADAQVEALLAEGQGTLLAALPAGTLDVDQLEWAGTAPSCASVASRQRRWLQELGRWRAEAEALCEERIWSSVLRNGVLGSGRPEPGQSVDAEMVAFQALEQAVVSGRVCEPQSANDCRVDGAVALHLEEPASEQRRAWLVMLGSLARWLEGGLQMSAAGGRPRASSAGRIALRLRVSCSTYAWWRGLEAQARRWLPCGMGWLRFLCLSLWEAWRHLLGPDVEYGQIYIRDRCRCTIPVCNRKDVTPHHLEFRSAGGSDEDSNVTSACTWCHLFGIHGGHIRAVGSAELIHWELGPRSSPCLVVHGRERVAA